MSDEHTNIEMVPLFEFYEEQRTLSRIDLRVPALSITDDRQTVGVITRNISPDGLQIRCTAKQALQLRPSGPAHCF